MWQLSDHWLNECRHPLMCRHSVSPETIRILPPPLFSHADLGKPVEVRNNKVRINGALRTVRWRLAEGADRPSDGWATIVGVTTLVDHKFPGYVEISNKDALDHERGWKFENRDAEAGGRQSVPFSPVSRETAPKCVFFLKRLPSALPTKPCSALVYFRNRSISCRSATSLSQPFRT